MNDSNRNEKHEKYFKSSHLPEGKIQKIAQSFRSMIVDLNKLTPEGPEKSAGVRKMLEAKDCFVRANLDN